MNILLLLLLLCIQCTSKHEFIIQSKLTKLDKGLMNKKEFNDFILQTERKIEFSSYKNDFMGLVQVEFNIVINRAIDSLGTSFKGLIKNFRNDLIHERNVNNSMLLLAMNNDTSSLVYIKHWLYENNLLNHFTALKSLAILSMYSNKLIEEVGVEGESHWFIPLRDVKKFVKSSLENNNSSTPWDIYQFNKKIDEIFWNKIYQCKLAEFLSSDSSPFESIKEPYFTTLKNASVSMSRMRLLSENAGIFKAVFGSHNNLIAIKHDNSIVRINTKDIRPVFSFGINKRTFVVLRGLDSISFDEIYELVNINESYKLKFIITLPYSTIDISDEGNYLIIKGTSWQVKINKELMVIEQGYICNENVIINQGI